MTSSKISHSKIYVFSFVPGDLLVEHRKCICANLGVIWYYPNCISKYHKTTKPDEQHRPICNCRAAIQNRRTRVLLTVDITSETFYSVSYMQYSAGDSHCPISESIVRFPYGSHNIIFRACLKTIYGCYCYARLFFSESLFMPCVCVCACVCVGGGGGAVVSSAAHSKLKRYFIYLLFNFEFIYTR